MNIRSVLLAATVLALPAAAIAQPVTGLYVAGGLGYNWTQNIDLKSGYGATLNDDGGLAAVGSAGWGFGNGVRVELEGNYGAGHFRVRNSGTDYGGVDTNNFGVFVNGLYDFNIGWPVVPYAGLGIGYEWTGARGGHAYRGAGYYGVVNNDTEGSVAGQVILGAALPLGVPGLSLTADYRFMATFEDESFGAYSYPGHTSYSTKIGNQYNHAVLIGVRYAFNAAPPPPPKMAPAPVAAPAPAPARTYLVFFDWDKSDLSARAHQIIAEAAQNSTLTAPARRSTTWCCRASAPTTWPPSWSRTACRRTLSRSRLSATPTCWCRPPRACASRRTVGSRSTCSSRRLTENAAVPRDGGVCLYAICSGRSAQFLTTVSTPPPSPPSRGGGKQGVSSFASSLAPYARPALPVPAAEAGIR
jgi:hypothetical protein